MLRTTRRSPGEMFSEEGSQLMVQLGRRRGDSPINSAVTGEQSHRRGGHRDTSMKMDEAMMSLLELELNTPLRQRGGAVV